MTTTTETPAPTFTAHDRCDRCGEQAQSRITLTNGQLLLCGTHYRKHRKALTTALTIEVRPEHDF
jgi:formylmethanofuran dehydrogenase subunit E